jgi:methionyl aminopeptidase
MKTRSAIKIKTSEDIALMREAGRILATIFYELESSLTIGRTTLDIDRIVESLISRHKVTAAFKGYRGFPGCACVSINEEIVHGIPGSRTIRDGDLVAVDIGIIHEGFYSDRAYTFGLGQVAPGMARLVQVTREALDKGIAQARPGGRLSDISHAVQQHVESNGFSVVREFVGHGIGRNLHEDPEIPNFGIPHQGPVLETGMVFAIEPMVNAGSWQTRIGSDGWTVVTRDGKPSAHFEHTVAVSESGPRILTEL